MEAFYVTVGVRDGVGIAELPDNVSAAGVSRAVSATGAVAYKTTPLLTPEEVDQASKKKVDYRPPGA